MSLLLRLFIEVPLPSQESKWSGIIFSTKPKHGSWKIISVQIHNMKTTFIYSNISFVKLILIEKLFGQKLVRSTLPINNVYDFL
jgi:hypothetical protein